MMKDSKKEEEDEEEQEVKRAIRVGDKPDPLEFAIAVLSESDDIEVSFFFLFSFFLSFGQIKNDKSVDLSDMLFFFFY